MIKVSFCYLENVNRCIDDSAYNKLLDTAAAYRKKYHDFAIGSIPGVEIARKLFHYLHIDPTKYRPSSEALLKRALKSKEFFRINTIVDICNWCSLDFLLPICAYDAEKISGPIALRLGESGESFLAHNNRIINQDNKFVLADEIGPFGAPITDSKRTGVTENSKKILLVIFANSTVEDEELRERSDLLAERIMAFCGGIKRESKIRYYKE